MGRHRLNLVSDIQTWEGVISFSKVKVSEMKEKI